MWHNDWWRRSFEAGEQDSPGNMPWHHTSVKLKHTDTHMYKVKAYTAWIQWSRNCDFFILSLMTQKRVLISMQNVPKTSNGRLWGGRERSHIKEINQRHNFGSTRAIFHLNHIAKHLAFNTLVLRRLLLLQLASSPLQHVTNSITTTAVHEVVISPSPLSLTCLLSFSCQRDDLTHFYSK